MPTSHERLEQDSKDYDNLMKALHGAYAQEFDVRGMRDEVQALMDRMDQILKECPAEPMTPRKPTVRLAMRRKRGKGKR